MPRARPALGRTYREVFGGTPDTQGFHSLREFATTVWRGGMGDHRLLAAHTEMSEGIPTEGGFLVPTEYAAQMLDRALESEIVRPLADVQPMQSQTKRISDFDRSDASSGAPAGFAAVWMNEGDTATPVVPKTRTIELTAKKLGLWVNATNEVVADAPQFENLLGNQMPEAIAWSMDNAFLTGTGAGMPLGVLNDPALLTVTKEASQPSTTLKYENLVKMFASLHPSLVRDAVWVANPTTIPQLLRLIVVIQNVGATENVGGSFVPVISERNGQFTILTRPVYFTEKLPTLGTKGDILLANFSQYCIGMRREVSLATSIHVKWLQDEMAYRCIVRADGQGKWSQAYKNKQGTSLSWCVVVENR
jgi:HK97 family phage major capsid protein